jgi:hypothetical protein
LIPVLTRSSRPKDEPSLRSASTKSSVRIELTVPSRRWVKVFGLPHHHIPLSLCKGRTSVFRRNNLSDFRKGAEMLECKCCHGTGKYSKCHGKSGKEGMFTKSVCSKCGGSGNCTVGKGKARV